MRRPVGVTAAEAREGLFTTHLTSRAQLTAPDAQADKVFTTLIKSLPRRGRGAWGVRG
jgi:hypothetical protein